MTRYNTARDDVNMRRLVGAWADGFGQGVSVEYTSDGCEHDANVYRGGQLIAVVEAKQRTCRFAQYPTYIISEAKINYLRNVGVPAFLVIGWTDRAGFTKVREGYSRAMGGRSDRGDPNDIEMMCHLPMSQFSLVEVNHG